MGQGAVVGQWAVVGRWPAPRGLPPRWTRYHRAGSTAAHRCKSARGEGAGAERSRRRGVSLLAGGRPRFGAERPKWRKRGGKNASDEYNLRAADNALVLMGVDIYLYIGPAYCSGLKGKFALAAEPLLSSVAQAAEPLLSTFASPRKGESSRSAKQDTK